MPVVLDPVENETRAIHDLVTFAGKDVLEIGSGDGRLTWRVADRAASVLAIDPNPTRIETALAETPEALRPKVAFRIADVTTLGLPEAAFDVAVLSWSI